jgi:hypothetical protein
MVNKLEFRSRVTLYSLLIDKDGIWTDIEIDPVRNVDGGAEQTYWEVCDEEGAEMWSVYRRLEEGGCECIADCDTKESAITVRDFILNLMASQALIEKHSILHQRLNDGRDYLMQVEADKITAEDCLIAFGWNASGFLEVGY